MKKYNVVSEGKVLNALPFNNKQLAFKFRKEKAKGNGAIVEVSEEQLKTAFL